MIILPERLITYQISKLQQEIKNLKNYVGNTYDDSIKEREHWILALKIYYEEHKELFEVCKEEYKSIEWEQRKKFIQRMCKRD